MILILKKSMTIVLILALFAVAAISVSSASTSSSTSIDEMTSFLTNVVGIDLTQYTLVQPTSQSTNINQSLLNEVSYPAEFAGQVKVETPVLNYSSTSGPLDTMGIFYNGQLVALRIYSQPNYIYSELPQTSVVSQATSIVESYQTFVSQQYSTGSSYLTSMQTTLQNVSTNKNAAIPANQTVGNMAFQSAQNGNNTDLTWIYTQNGIMMNYKKVELTFENNAFVSFLDTWNIYKVSGPSVISSNQALQIALNAAQNYQLNVSTSTGTELSNVPDLSNAPHDVSFAMLPYRYSTTDLPSNTPRDALTLYPLWQFHFYFNNTIAGDNGIQVGVWGDTSEVLYCSGFGYFDTSNVSNQLGQQSSNDYISIVAAIIGMAAVLMISSAIIFSEHKKADHARSRKKK